MITALIPGKIQFRDAEDKINILAVSGGFLEVSNNKATLLADAVAEVVPGVKVSVNPDAPPDKRSYKVNFDLFKEIAPDHQPIHDLKSSIQALYDNLSAMGFDDKNYRESHLTRLSVLNVLQESNYLNSNLEWTW